MNILSMKSEIPFTQFKSVARFGPDDHPTVAALTQTTSNRCAVDSWERSSREFSSRVAIADETWMYYKPEIKRQWVFRTNLFRKRRRRPYRSETSWLRFFRIRWDLAETDSELLDLFAEELREVRFRLVKERTPFHKRTGESVRNRRG